MFFTGLSNDPNNSGRVGKSGFSQLWCYNRAAAAAASGDQQEQSASRNSIGVMRS